MPDQFPRLSRFSASDAAGCRVRRDPEWPYASNCKPQRDLQLLVSNCDGRGRRHLTKSFSLANSASQTGDKTRGAAITDARRSPSTSVSASFFFDLSSREHRPLVLENPSLRRTIGAKFAAMIGRDP